MKRSKRKLEWGNWVFDGTQKRLYHKTSQDEIYLKEINSSEILDFIFEIDSREKSQTTYNLLRAFRDLVDLQKNKGLLEPYLILEDKELLERAAEIEDITLIDFVIRSALEKASLVLGENPPIKLNSEDSLAFAESLLNPPEPNERSIAAAAEYKKSMGRSIIN